MAGILDQLEDSDINLSDGEDDTGLGNIMPADNQMNILLQSSSESEDEDSNDDQVTSGRLRWRRKQFRPSLLPAFQMSMNEDYCTDWDEMYFFSQYVDDNILDQMTEATNRSYLKLKGGTLAVTSNELRKFFGISVAMSCIQYAQIRMYWESRWRIPIVADNMTRDRFWAIRSALKVVYDDDVVRSLKEKDKLWKIRPFIEKIREGCLAQPKEFNLSVDEMMVPFSGRCKFKQYVKGKPNPVGIKVFVIATPSGVVLDFLCYQGSTTFDKKYEKVGLGTAAVLTLVEKLEPGHNLFYDRYFSSIKLAECLHDLGHHSTGTIMLNRLPKDVSLLSDKDLREKGRGTSDVTVRSDNKMAVTKWMDNKPVTLLSTIYGQHPEEDCTRWSKKDKIFIKIKIPAVIHNYNANMGGVDMANLMNSYCPMRARTKK